MSTEPVDRATLSPDLRALLDELGARIATSPLLATLGGTVLDWGPGWAEVAVPTTSASANIAGTVHGAILTAAADSAFETACNSYGRMCVAVSLSAQFTGPAAVGTELRAVAREVSRSRSLASYHVDVTDGSGRLVAWFQALAHRSPRVAPRVGTVARRMARSVPTSPAHGVAPAPVSCAISSPSPTAAQWTVPWPASLHRMKWNCSTRTDRPVAGTPTSGVPVCVPVSTTGGRRDRPRRRGPRPSSRGRAAHSGASS